MATKKKSATSRNYLHKAYDVSEQRDSTYGGADENFQRIANLMTAQLGLVEELPNSGCLTRPLTKEDVALLMIQVKASRLAKMPTHEDSWVDIAGYVNCVSMLQTGE